MEVSEGPHFFSESFGEVLPVLDDQALVVWQVVVVVGKCDERIFVVHLGLVRCSNCPVTGAPEATAATLTARDFEREVVVAFLLLEAYSPPGCFIGG